MNAGSARETTLASTTDNGEASRSSRRASKTPAPVLPVDRPALGTGPQPTYYPPVNGNVPLDLDMAQFLQRGAPPVSMPNAHPISPLLSPDSERRVLEALAADHTTFLSIMQSRAHSLEAVRQVWTPDTSVLPTLQACLRLRDAAVTVDVLKLLQQKPKLINLASCGVLLELVQEVLVAGFADYAAVACTLVQLLIKAFRGLLLDTLAPPRLGPGGSMPPTPGGGVDLVMEERVLKCKACVLGLLRVRATLHALPRQDTVVRGALEQLCLLDELVAGP
jgi:hypothetical protein